MEPELTDPASRWPNWKDPDPFVGVSLAAVTGILLADWFGGNPLMAQGVFLLAVLLWFGRSHASLCLVIVAAAFGAVHLSRSTFRARSCSPDSLTILKASMQSAPWSMNPNLPG